MSMDRGSSNDLSLCCKCCWLLTLPMPSFSQLPNLPVIETKLQLSSGFICLPSSYCPYFLACLFRRRSHYLCSHRKEVLVRSSFLVIFYADASIYLRVNLLSLSFLPVFVSAFCLVYQFCIQSLSLLFLYTYSSLQTHGTIHTVRRIGVFVIGATVWSRWIP